MIIRTVEQKDADRIYEMTCQLEDKALDRAGFDTAFCFAIANDEMYAMEDDGKIIAFLHTHYSLQLCRADMIAEIRELVVDEGYRDKGYGKSLLAYAVNKVREKGIDMIEILSSSYRVDAHRFYENNGFEKTGYRFFNKDRNKG